jgi:hypothetical protein
VCIDAKIFFKISFFIDLRKLPKNFFKFSRQYTQLLLIQGRSSCFRCNTQTFQKSPTSHAIFNGNVNDSNGYLCTFRLKNSTLFKKFVYYNENMNTNFKRNYLKNYNGSEHTVKTKNAPFFMNFPNI